MRSENRLNGRRSRLILPRTGKLPVLASGLGYERGDRTYLPEPKYVVRAYRASAVSKGTDLAHAPQVRRRGVGSAQPVAPTPNQTSAAVVVMMPTGFTVHRWRLGPYYEPQTERLIFEPASWLAAVTPSPNHRFYISRYA